MPSPILHTRTRGPLSASSRTFLHRVLAVSRLNKRHVIQTRSLWWWGRSGSWSSANDEIQERIYKHQKIMRHKYTRALRRRAMWERDNSLPLWSWRAPEKLLGRHWCNRPLSTTDSLQAKLKEQESGVPIHDRPWEDTQRAFEAFKAKIDEAVRRDPYSVVFGRRFGHHPWVHNSSWASFSNLFKGDEDRTHSPQCKSDNQPQKIKIEDVDQPTPASQSTQPRTTTAPYSLKSSVTKEAHPADDYVYDPISGRKVPKGTHQSLEPESSKKPFLETLFAEHRAEDLVHGKQVPKEDVRSRESASSLFENSRTSEYQRLRIATIGNSIDTTIMYDESYKPEHSVDDDVSNKGIRVMPEPDEEAPPFSGTTYASRSHVSKQVKPDSPTPKHSWLQQEGFQQSKSSNAAPLLSSATNDTISRLQPTLDRVQSEGRPAEKKFVTKLQPSIDRLETPKQTYHYVKRPAPLNLTTQPPPIVSQAERQTAKNASNKDEREDLDLLRASDVRAAIRTIRVTRHETEKAKIEARNKLETDFASRQKAAEFSADMDSARSAIRNSKGVSSVDSVKKHMQRYPDGVVARTMRSMGIFNDNFKKYEKPVQTHVNLTEKIELKAEALEKLPSIFKPRSTGPATTLKVNRPPGSLALEENLKVEAENAESRALANRQAKEENQKEDQRVEDLAKSIRQAYETHNGSIKTQVEALLKEKHTPKASHPLKTATVRAGVHIDPDIEYHITVFEPKLIQLREKAKIVHKNLVSVNHVLDTLVSVKSEYKAGHKALPHPIVEQNVQLENSLARDHIASSEKQQVRAMRALNEELKCSRRIPADSRVPAILSETSSSAQTTVFSSPYIILTYNKSTDQINTTQLNSLMNSHTKSEKMNPIAVMGSLNYPAAFVPRLVELENAGYQVAGGGGDMLIFQKQAQILNDITRAEALESIKLIKSDISELRNKITLEEASVQPVFETASIRAVPKATLPAEPPSSSPSEPVTPTPSANGKKKSRDGPKIRRQEQVFSGTIRPKTRSDSTNTNEPRQLGFFSRLYTMMTRVVMTTFVLGSAAYVIGVVAEGVSAQAQREGVDTAGPRKKVVMPAQRPGIYSTESTRD